MSLRQSFGTRWPLLCFRIHSKAPPSERSSWCCPSSISSPLVRPPWPSLPLRHTPCCNHTPVLGVSAGCLFPQTMVCMVGRPHLGFVPALGNRSCTQCWCHGGHSQPPGSEGRRSRWASGLALAGSVHYLLTMAGGTEVPGPADMERGRAACQGCMLVGPECGEWGERGGQPRRGQPGKAEASRSQQGSGGHGQERFLSGSEHLPYILRVNLRIGLIYSATATETTARKRSKLTALERSIRERIFPPLTQGKTWRPCRRAACLKSPRARP